MNELVKRLREAAIIADSGNEISESLYRDILQAADSIEKLSYQVDSLRIFADNISKLPDCNTCLKKGLCEFEPRLGEYCRINCPMWSGVPEAPKEES